MASTPSGQEPSDSAHPQSQPSDTEPLAAKPTASKPPATTPPPQQPKPEKNGAGFFARIGRGWATRDTIVAVVAAVLGSVLSVGLTFFIVPRQEVAGQRAVESERASQDRSTPPGSVTGVHGGIPEGGSYVSDTSIPLNGATPAMVGPWDDIASVLPDAVPVKVPDGYTNSSLPGADDEVNFTVRGQHHQTVRITDINVVVTERKPAPAATIVYYPPREATAGMAPNIQLGFDLDSPDTSARAVGIGNNSNDDYFRQNTVTLNENESIGFESKVITRECSCTYVLEVHFDDGNTVRIGRNTSDQRGFVLTALRPNYQHYYVPQTSGPKNQTVLTECPSFDVCRDMAYRPAPP